MIFSGQASVGSIYTDQGKRPDQTKTNSNKLSIRTTIQNHPKENKKRNRKRKETIG
jgi:hypothetical protein